MTAKKPASRKTTASLATLVLAAAVYFGWDWLGLPKSNAGESAGASTESTAGPEAAGPTVAKTPHTRREPVETATPSATTNSAPAPRPRTVATEIDADTRRMAAAIKTPQLEEEFWVESQGTVFRLLSDDNEPPRHQRWLIKIGTGDVVKLAHNTDLAPRVPAKEGDIVAFRGKFADNDRGGAVHWTHRDSRGRTKGWIRHDGKMYQ